MLEPRFLMLEAKNAKALEAHLNTLSPNWRLVSVTVAVAKMDHFYTAWLQLDYGEPL